MRIDCVTKLPISSGIEVAYINKFSCCGFLTDFSISASRVAFSVSFSCVTFNTASMRNNMFHVKDSYSILWLAHCQGFYYISPRLTILQSISTFSQTYFQIVQHWWINISTRHKHIYSLISDILHSQTHIRVWTGLNLQAKFTQLWKCNELLSSFRWFFVCFTSTPLLPLSTHPYSSAPISGSCTTSVSVSAF